MAHPQNFICIGYQHFRDVICNIVVKCKYLFSVSAKLKCMEFSTKENCKIKLQQKIVFCGILDRFPCLLESRGIVLYKISRTWKVMVNEFDVLEILVQGPGKSRNLLGSDADTDTKICSVHTPLFCVQTVFFAFLRSMYQWWTDTPVLEFFVTERVGTPFTDLYPFICFTHTHTRLTALCPGLPGWAGSRKAKTNLDFTEARDSEWQWHINISWAICKSAPCSRQITTPAPHHSVFLQAGCPSCHPTNSVKALKALSLSFYLF